MAHIENHKKKKYEYLPKDYDTIFNPNEKETELLNQHYNSGINYNYDTSVKHGDNNDNIYNNNNNNNYNDYLSNNPSNVQYMKKNKKNKTNMEKIKLINKIPLHQQMNNANEYDHININYDSNDECLETHYDFENKYNNDKNLENRILIESEDFISSRRNSTRSKIVIAGKIVLAILFFILVVFLFTRFKNFLNIIHIVIEWVGKQGSWSILLFISLFTFLSPLFMSVEIMCVGSGLIFSGVYGKALGIFVAVFSVAVGYVLGMSLCFFISRYLIHNYIYKKLMGYPIYMAFNQAINTNGLSFVLLIRLSPILPASVVSYILGVTSLKYKHFAIGSISALPSIFLFVYIGVLLQDISNLSELENHWTNLIILFVGFLIGVIAIVYISVITKRRLNNLNIMNASLSTTNADIE
ncbi:SNARE associated Golgi protein, putative [Plasmodium reichenowi]|uniref:SNARE associated Golgi protein, putative n=1 Tax=Plasmodium reichenowi TaxID=5854 RepID=A0A2P9DMN4_PLARE|nr:SNARE associated Golgi protein, putative [Plasmodium reichenowi]